ncbi:MAG: tRNA 5-methoxyuridine(34)/uridine 5-oxyacetic acid(34) synthase CmoB [Zetaproteobacteria bacterium CG12_big_fil_rev_8_21_14_0_65_54_13]|nr:MAG: tRNA 5-methoxyuridine(34)/uridine 5-oxyacetic acid(34) synthase CmoB [Zetaproteobacteria bacterium CG12_big_fil_rev_8_21_14_0_65_54_13]PIX54915.1 MAG: tRNA 5-methoxyuridine(34)/uridine 5-oxyacetic acid(34) synthase CmoB [Zetaproteobacteria bacterium CG_4_10_14_3_um_filter_54_28]PJA31072.1 MAG: tRNA 5-methoxyuridine(34)/uridine 5-oxyacetic acid(34) synthase CmoB [Zetaproteobacteria bacterium CG_4_9_14_3_um_filter_54_145]
MILPPETDALGQWLADSPLSTHAEALQQLVGRAIELAEQHGDYPRWQQALAQLPAVHPGSLALDSSAIRIGQADDCSAIEQAQLLLALQTLHPWRKGPFDFFGTRIDTEWRSDWKWDRLKDAIQPLAGRTVLDIGCGSGYHCWRMRAAGATRVIGIDPTILFLMQFRAAQHYIRDEAVQFWPVGIDELPANMACFDSVFSMGILYHRRSPIDHLLQLKDLLRTGGQLVLETLVVEGDAQACLIPDGRYAKMRNIWFLPSVAMLKVWLKRSGFHDIRLVDVGPTTTEEQRATDWMRFESLADYLDPLDPSRTIEGHPAPLRAVLTAIK